MSRVISTTVYLSDELSESAREKARAWYCEGGWSMTGTVMFMRISP